MGIKLSGNINFASIVRDTLGKVAFRYTKDTVKVSITLRERRLYFMRGVCYKIN